MLSKYNAQFTNTLAKKHKDDETPRLSVNEKKFETTTNTQNCFENTEEVETYWRKLWETVAEDNLETSWIEELEESTGEGDKRRRNRKKSKRKCQ